MLGTNSKDNSKVSPNKPMLGSTNMYNMRVRQIMKQREKQVKMEQKAASSNRNASQGVDQNQFVIREETLEQSPSPMVEVKTTTPNRADESGGNVGEFAL